MKNSRPDDWVYCIGLFATFFWCQGCENSTAQGLNQDQVLLASEEGHGASSAPKADFVVEESQQHAQRLAEALNHHKQTVQESTNIESVSISSGDSSDPIREWPPTVAWIEADEAVNEPEEDEPEEAEEKQTVALVSQPANASGPQGQSIEASGELTDEGHDPSGIAALPQDPQILLSQLRQSIQSKPGDAMKKAVVAAALSLADPQNDLSTADLADLDAHQRLQVRRFHQLITYLSKKITTGETTNQDRTLLARINQLVEHEAPIRIRRVELCQRVQDYGVYEPFEDHDFMAGRGQAIIVYAELDYFDIEAMADDHYKVRLAQEVILYNESGSLEVWRQPRVNIEDVSRNRRRDFFVVQLIHLPSGLTAGRYRLKLRVTDLADNSSDEDMVPIQIVADPALVNQEVR